jgi:hypothetical protein
MAVRSFGRRSISLEAVAACLLLMGCNIVHLESYAVCLSSPTSTVRAHAKSFPSCYSKQSAFSLPCFRPLWLLTSRTSSTERDQMSTHSGRTSRSRLLGLNMGCVPCMSRNCRWRQAALPFARTYRSSFALRLSESGRHSSDDDNATKSATIPPPWEAAISAMCEGSTVAPICDAGDRAEMVVIGKIIIDEFVLR